MASKATVQSVEPNVADLVNGWLKSYKVDYKLEQESLNTEIDQALNDYFSKNGGKGGNRPDAKLLLLANDGKYYPILIEYKGYKDKLVKLDAEGNVANRNAKNQPDFATINSYAVNGAVHYANAVLHYEGHIDPEKGNDWNQTAPIDTRPTLDDFKKTISDYLAWEVSTLLKNQPTEDDRLGK